MNRRRFLASSAGTLAGCALPRLVLAATGPGLIELEAVKGQAELYGKEGKLSDLWLYNGSLPGPELRLRKGETLSVRFTNRLDEPTSIHWHGIRIDNAMDGVAGLTQPPVQPGESFDYTFTVPDAGTFWYHAHTMSWNQVPRGLSGVLIVEEETPFVPRDRDLTLFLSDWRLDEEGVLITAGLGSMHDFSHAGRLGNWLTVNGQSRPDIPVVRGAWHRLRLVNASSARVLDLEPSRFGAQLLALDGQALPALRKVEGPVRLAPGQRMDLVIKPEGDLPIPFELTTGQPFVFARFLPRDAAAGAADDDLPALPAPNALPEPNLANARELPLEMAGGAMGGMRIMMQRGLDPQALMADGKFWIFNGAPGSLETPMFKVARGESVVLNVSNLSGFPHAVHLHGHHFRVLELNGTELDPADWHDTVTLEPEERARIAFVADNPGKWLLHCHMLGHAASGMTGWFEVA